MFRFAERNKKMDNDELWILLAKWKLKKIQKTMEKNI